MAVGSIWKLIFYFFFFYISFFSSISFPFSKMCIFSSAKAAALLGGKSIASRQVYMDLTFVFYSNSLLHILLYYFLNYALRVNYYTIVHTQSIGALIVLQWFGFTIKCIIVESGDCEFNTTTFKHGWLSGKKINQYLNIIAVQLWVVKRVLFVEILPALQAL